MQRLVSMSRSGRYVAIRQVDGLDVVDAMGTAPRKSMDVGDLDDFSCVGSTLWLLGGGRLRRHLLDGGEHLEPDAVVGTGRLVPAHGSDDHVALLLGERRLLVQTFGDDVRVEDVSEETEGATLAVPLAGRRLLLADDGRLRIRDAGRGDVMSTPLTAGTRVLAGSGLFGGRAIAMLVAGEDRTRFAVLRPSGSFVHDVPLPSARVAAIASTRGLGLVYTQERKLVSVDLRYGRVLAEVDAPLPIEELAIDCDGKYLLMAGYRDDESLAALHVPYTDVFGGGGNLSRARRPRPEAHAADSGNGHAAGASAEPGAEDAPPARRRGELAGHTEAPRVDAAAEDAVPDDDDEPAPAEPVEIPDLPLHGLGIVEPPPSASAPAGTQPYDSAQDHLDELLDLVAARTARAIARAWDSGRLSLPAEDARPFEREVKALVGGSLSLAPDAVAEAEERLNMLTARAGRRALASIAAGLELPFVAIAREFDLSTTAAQVLLVAAAPALRGEIARLYGVLANDENRPICDRYLVELILGGEQHGMRHQVARELTIDAPLVKHGLVRISAPANDQYLFASISVDRVLLGRLRGDRFAGTGPGEATELRLADRTLEELVMPDELKRDIVLALARRTRRPVRVVVRGRRGVGRRSLLAALAARVDRPLAVIECERLPRRGRVFADALRTELRRASLRGAVPCVSGLELSGEDDAELTDQVRAVLRTHAGPVTFRTSPEAKLPLEPGHVSFHIPALSESERLAFWRDALAQHGVHAGGVERLAARFRIGPGTIESVIAEVRERAVAEPTGEELDDRTEVLDAAARQHIDARMGSVATHMTRLARWEQVALPDDVLDSIREFIGRVQHRRTVYDAWGFDAKMSTARGLTALFYGPPGTGKSMVAGLIARELGLELYRVDLARITSKWIGETEKNLAEVFDAGEDGQVVILFDEADSLFAKRTEVKSSVDRYANLEVNYLLQRFDTFEGVAILTTNLEGSIDQAFKRRMSLRLAFPFPDEDMRVRLWAAHIPPEVPNQADFDFAELARRFPLSGGYIRNSALRAAFLAAQEEQLLSHDHLVRAIHLEYRELGKLAPGGRME